MRLVEVSCCYCGKVHKKTSIEIKRKLKHDSKFFCSRSCSAKGNSSKNPRGKDEFTVFRKFLNKANSRKIIKDFDCDITLEYLKELWEKQRGVCPYLGIVLSLGPTRNPNLKASLDRIDSSKGYIKGNVQFISMTMNYAKSSFNEEVLYNLIDLIVKNHGPDRFSTALMSKK